VAATSAAGEVRESTAPVILIINKVNRKVSRNYHAEQDRVVEEWKL
jgi:hypothetical protein